MPYSDPLKKKARDRAYHLANREARNAYSKAWRLSHPEYSTNEATKRWAETIPGMISRARATLKYRAKKRSV